MLRAFLVTLFLLSVGKFSMASENLGGTLDELAKKIDHITKSLEQDIDIVVKSALSELSQPIQEFQNRVLSMRCQPFFTFERLGQTIESDLDKCTQKLNGLTSQFQREANEYNNALDGSIKQMMDSITTCEGVNYDSGFGSSASCYVAKISDAYNQISNVLNDANLNLIQTQQLAEEAVKDGQRCAGNVVTSTKKLMDKILGYCQVVQH